MKIREYFEFRKKVKNKVRRELMISPKKENNGIKRFRIVYIKRSFAYLSFAT